MFAGNSALETPYGHCSHYKSTILALFNLSIKLKLTQMSAVMMYVSLNIIQFYNLVKH
jgi:hypothetical protein